METKIYLLLIFLFWTKGVLKKKKLEKKFTKKNKQTQNFFFLSLIYVVAFCLRKKE